MHLITLAARRCRVLDNFTQHSLHWAATWNFFFYAAHEELGDNHESAKGVDTQCKYTGTEKPCPPKCDLVERLTHNSEKIVQGQTYVEALCMGSSNNSLTNGMP